MCGCTKFSAVMRTVRDRLFRVIKNIYQQDLKLGANEASAQGLQNSI
jgi:hypothetical protein